jgi:hypothetical protein
MHFEKHGRAYQLRIRTAEDLEHVLSLDDSLWVAMSAPVSGLNCDAEFLEFVDLDRNQRIRTGELRVAVQWLFERLAARERLADGVADVSLAGMDDSHAGGRRCREAARYILQAVGAASQDSISLSQVRAFEEGLEGSVINGDGVIPPGAAEDEDTQRFISDVMDCVGGHEDLTGQQGITDDDLSRFLDQAQRYLDWVGQADLPAGQASTEVMPLGEETRAAFEAFQAVADKVDAFFARCRVLRFDPAAAERISISANGIGPEDLIDAEAIDGALARAPLAEPNVDGVLPLDGLTNPAYRTQLREFRELVAELILGPGVSELSESDWSRIKGKLKPHGDWLASKEGADVERLGRETLASYLKGSCASSVREILGRDREVAKRRAEVRDLKKLLLYHKHLLQLANNFVSFPDLYDPARRAMFEVGSLVIDGRWFNFAVRIENTAEHSELAKTSGMHVVYAELTRVDEADKIVIAAPATAGTAGNLCVGKRGVFYDTLGRHYDARVIQIIENPISFLEALIAPFVRLGRFIGGKIEAISGSAQKEMESQVGRATDRVQVGVQEAVRQVPSAAESASQAAPAVNTGSQAAARRDLLVGASVSIAALSSAFAFVTSQLSRALQRPSYVIMAFVLVLLVVFVPTAVVAALKLRRRDLSAILEGCGWAINARMRLNRRQRRQFTRQEPYPKDATGTPPSRWPLYVLLFALLCAAAVGIATAWREWTADRGRQQPVAPAPSAPAPEEPTQ